jgi:prepilin-type N-terminal cleavage/methylation domain-containing protein
MRGNIDSLAPQRFPIQHRRGGFTLIELIIVVAIIAILAAIAIPGLIRGRMAANETSAITSLKTLLTAQEQFRQARAVDIDLDGQGEFGYIQELTGVVTCRIPGGISGPTLAPPVLGQQFGSSALIAGGVAEKSGYSFLIYLPSATTAVAESVPLPPGNPADTNAQENRWIAYAWPNQQGTTGNRCFVVTRDGTIYQAANAATAYNGLTLPAAAAALDTAGPDPANLDANVASASATTSGDGQNWTPAGG